MRRPSEMPVSVGPIPSWRSRRSRRRSSSRATTMATLERRSSVASCIQRTASVIGPVRFVRTSSSRVRSDGPCSQPTTSRPTTWSRWRSSTSRWCVVGRPTDTTRCHSSGSTTSMATASTRSSRIRSWASEASRSSLPEPTWSTTRCTRASGIVSRSVDEPVDEAVDVPPGRFERQCDRSRRGDQEPRRTGSSDELAEAGDEHRVDDEDARRQGDPLDGAVHGSLPAAGRTANELQRDAGHEQRHGGHEQQWRHDVAARQPPARQVGGVEHDGEPGDHRSGSQPCRQRVTTRALFPPPAHDDCGGRDGGRDAEHPGGDGRDLAPDRRAPRDDHHE